MYICPEVINSTVVEHSTRYSKIEGSKDAASAGKGKMAKKFIVHLSKGDRTVVEHLTCYPKIEGAASTRKEKES